LNRIATEHIKNRKWSICIDSNNHTHSKYLGEKIEEKEQGFVYQIKAIILLF
jgi:hypothetical protein